MDDELTIFLVSIDERLGRIEKNAIATENRLIGRLEKTETALENRLVARMDLTASALRDERLSLIEPDACASSRPTILPLVRGKIAGI